MKICFDHQAFTAQEIGGISRYYSEIIKCALIEKADKIKIFTGLHRNRYIAEPVFKNLRSWPSLKIRRIHGLGTINRRLWRIIGPARGCDVYHSTNYEVLRAPPETARVTTVHDCIDERFNCGDDRCTNPRVKKLINKKYSSVAASDVVLCNSNSTRDDILRFSGVDGLKVRVTYLGCSEVFQPNYGERKKFILYVGGRNGYKNFDLLKKAYENEERIWRNYSLVCFGGGMLTAAERPKAGLAEHHVGDDRKLAELYREAAMLVYPSLFEGFGLPVLEALRSGCPVITTRGGSLPEVGGAHATYCSGTNISELQTGILQTAQRRDWALAREAGARHAMTFSWGRCWKETRKAYEYAVEAASIRFRNAKGL